MEDGRGIKRVTVRKAAILLGVSEGAVRKRVDRGTLEHDKGTDGKVYVYLPVAEPGVRDGVDASTTLESNALISEMKDRITFLEDELRRKDAILMNMTETMKAITAPPPPRESSVPSSQGDGAAPQDQEKGSWWQRLFSA